jgi:hypothetical protein
MKEPRTTMIDDPMMLQINPNGFLALLLRRYMCVIP